MTSLAVRACPVSKVCVQSHTISHCHPTVGIVFIVAIFQRSSIHKALLQWADSRLIRFLRQMPNSISVTFWAQTIDLWLISV